MLKRNTQKNKKVSPIEKLASESMLKKEMFRPRPMVHVCCEGDVEIESSKGILLYSNTNVCIDMGNMCVDITGDDLRLKTLMREKIIVKGRVFSIVFRSKKEGESIG